MSKKKYKALLEDEDVRRWYVNVSRGAEVTADVNLRRLGNFCERVRLHPKDLLKMDDKALKNLILDYITDMELKGYAGSYIYSTLKAIKSWLSFNDRELRAKIKIKGSNEYPNTYDERVPTQAELKSILLSGNKRARTACSLVAFSGIRLQVLGNYRGKDGLRVMDFPEMVISNGEVEFENIPTMIIVRPPLSKVGHQYFTFLCKEGCEILKSYLEERIRKGEELNEKSPIITPIARYLWGKCISTINIGDIIRQAIRKAGFSWRPYVLRHYFDTQLLLAESKGLVIRDYRQFWMGHKGDIEHQYTTNRNKLPEDLVEDMRDAYARASVYLETDGREELTNAERIRMELRKAMLVFAGLSEDEIASLDLASMSEEEFFQLFKERTLGNGPKQRVVDISEAEKLINSGWEFVATLPNGKVILKQ